jgi:hypothetical protein
VAARAVADGYAVDARARVVRNLLSATPAETEKVRCRRRSPLLGFYARALMRQPIHHSIPMDASVHLPLQPGAPCIAGVSRAFRKLMATND